MSKLKISNIKLIFIALFYRTFTNTIITIPKDINDNEIILSSLLFCFIIVVLILGLVMLFAYLLTNFIIL